MHYVYIASDSKHKLYVGITQNIERRILVHNSKQGALYTKSGNFKIVFYEQYLTLTDARQREIQIKKWRRVKKEMLIERFRKGLQTKLV